MTTWDPDQPMPRGLPRPRKDVPGFGSLPVPYVSDRGVADMNKERTKEINTTDVCQVCGLDIDKDQPSVRWTNGHHPALEGIAIFTPMHKPCGNMARKVCPRLKGTPDTDWEFGTGGRSTWQRTASQEKFDLQGLSPQFMQKIMQKCYEDHKSLDSARGVNTYHSEPLSVGMETIVPKEVNRRGTEDEHTHTVALRYTAPPHDQWALYGVNEGTGDIELYAN